jgi:hypothetical protein
MFVNLVVHIQKIEIDEYHVSKKNTQKKNFKFAIKHKLAK